VYMVCSRSMGYIRFIKCDIVKLGEKRNKRKYI